MILTSDKNSIYEAADRLEALATALRRRAGEARYETVYVSGDLPATDNNAELPSDEQRRQIFAALGLPHNAAREDLAHNVVVRPRWERAARDVDVDRLV